MTVLTASLFEVPLAFAEAPDWPSTKPQPSLFYDVYPYTPTRPGASVQPVLRDRLIAHPQIDLNQYRCGAEIDWLELFLETPDRRQAVNLHRAIRRMLEELGSTSTVFVSLRSMNKITDRRDPDAGTAVPLRLKDCRARLEVTLKAEEGEVGGHGAIGLVRVADLYGFDFQKELRKLVFEFFLPTFGIPCETASLGFPVKASEIEVFKRSGVYGLDRLHRAIHDINLCRHKQGKLADRPVTLRRKGRLVSWEEMNKKVNRALDRLSKDWAG